MQPFLPHAGSPRLYHTHRLDFSQDQRGPPLNLQDFEDLERLPQHEQSCLLLQTGFHLNPDMLLICCSSLCGLHSLYNFPLSPHQDLSLCPCCELTYCPPTDNKDFTDPLSPLADPVPETISPLFPDEDLGSTMDVIGPLIFCASRNFAKYPPGIFTSSFHVPISLMVPSLPKNIIMSASLMEENVNCKTGLALGPHLDNIPHNFPLVHSIRPSVGSSRRRIPVQMQCSRCAYLHFTTRELSSTWTTLRNFSLF